MLVYPVFYLFFSLPQKKWHGLMDVQLKAQGQKRWILVQLVVGMWRRYRFAHFFHLYSGDGNSNTTSSFQLPVWTLSLWTLLVDGAQNTPGSW